jgi:hypothetical protein
MGKSSKVARRAKPRVELVPSSAVVAAARALTFGALTKYPERGFARRVSRDEHVGAVLRHLLAWKDGDTRDAESGLSHLDHAIARLALLVEMDLRAGRRKERR